MQITVQGYSLEVNGLKQETTNHRYLSSFCCHSNEFNLTVSFFKVHLTPNTISAKM